MMTLQRQRTQHGFTMVELLITIGILAVLTAFATPAVTKTMRKTQLNREVSAVVEALQSARSEAVIRRRQCHAVLTPSLATATCNVTGEVMPNVAMKHAVMQPERLEVEYDFMGRSPTAYNSPNQCINIVMRHRGDSNVVASIEVREVGSPDVLKLEQNECRKR